MRTAILRVLSLGVLLVLAACNAQPAQTPVQFEVPQGWTLSHNLTEESIQQWESEGVQSFDIYVDINDEKSASLTISPNDETPIPCENVNESIITFMTTKTYYSAWVGYGSGGNCQDKPFREQVVNGVQYFVNQLNQMAEPIHACFDTRGESETVINQALQFEENASRTDSSYSVFLYISYGYNTANLYQICYEFNNQNEDLLITHSSELNNGYLMTKVESHPLQLQDRISSLFDLAASTNQQS